MQQLMRLAEQLDMVGHALKLDLDDLKNLKTPCVLLDKHGSPITGNNTRAPPLKAAEQTTMFDDLTIQRDFDFGAWHKRNIMMLEYSIF